MFKRFLYNWFAISKKEFNGIVVLLLLLLLVVTMPIFIALFVPKNQYNFDEIKRITSNLKEEIIVVDNIKSTESNLPNVQLFFFDPNTLSEAGFAQLGLKPFQVKTLLNYRNKGGQFRTPDDFKKIYSITDADFERLAPYIDIKPKETVARIPVERTPFERKKVFIELNSADSVQLTEARGIGPAFASRIIKYRDRLGGFYAKAQLREVWGVDSAKFDELAPQLWVDSTIIRYININTAEFDDLKTFPYLRFNQINALINYRKQHGNYKSESDLLKIGAIPPETIRKLAPYLKF